MPNRSNTSRSYQLAPRQHRVTESISGFSPRQAAFQPHALVAFDRMQMIDHLEARLGRIAIHRRDRAQAHELLIVLQKPADARDLRRRDFQRQLAAVELAAGDGIARRRPPRQRPALFSQSCREACQSLPLPVRGGIRATNPARPFSRCRKTRPESTPRRPASRRTRTSSVRGYTTAHGYRKMASISNRMKSIATR